MRPGLSRRSFLKYGAAAAAAGLAAPPLHAATPAPAAAAAPQAFELEEVTIAQLQDAMRTGARTSRSICEAYLARIAALDPRLNAVLETNPDALAIADRLDAERKAGRVRGPLHGIPLLVKDNIATDDQMRTAVANVYAAGDVAGRWQLAHTAFREGEIAAENAMGHEARLGDPAVPRPIYTDPEIAGVGLTETEAKEQYGEANVSVGVFPWVANARAVMSGDTTGWVKSIHETTYGELLGLVIVGPHATDLIEVGVVALDAEATVETLADGIAPHPTLSEAIKEAGLVALGRAIHLPPKRR